MSTPLNTEYIQGVILASSSSFLENKHGAKRPFLRWSLSMEQSNLIYEKKNSVLNTSKHNMEKKYLGNLAGS